MIDILNNTNDRADENIIARKYGALSDEIVQLRMKTLSSSYVDADQNLKVTESPKNTALHSRIADKTSQLKRVEFIVEEISSILEKNKVTTIRELQEKRAEIDNVIQSTPRRMWQKFVMIRGEGAAIPELNRVSWLPGDLCKVPEYAKAESDARSDIKKAQAAYPAINKDLERISVLLTEIVGIVV
jgi:hypothetical protein